MPPRCHQPAGLVAPVALECSADPATTPLLSQGILAEPPTEKRKVVGSTPTLATENAPASAGAFCVIRLGREPAAAARSAASSGGPPCSERSGELGGVDPDPGHAKELRFGGAFCVMAVR